MAAYASRRGYDPQRLTWWKKRLAEDGDGGNRGTRSVALAPAVITGVGHGYAAVTVAVTGSSVRIEVEDPSAVAPGWVGQLVGEVRGQVESIS